MKEVADPAGVFTVRAVSEMTGVNPATLRAWERRYRLVQPARSEAGHRLYSAEDVERVRRIVGWVRQGISPAQVGHLLRDADRARAPGAGDWEERRSRAIEAVTRFDEPALEALYRATLAAHPLVDVTESLTVPVLEALGRRWETGEGLVAEEHFFRLYVRNALGSTLFHRLRGQRGRTLVTACVSGERHDIGLLLFGLAAEADGWRVINLGADTPLAELPRVARTCNAAAIVLSATYSNGTTNWTAELGRVTGNGACPVLVGGRAAERLRQDIERAGGVVLGSDVREGVSRLDRLLEPEAP